MPGRNGTGPMGNGPATGRNFGNCKTNNSRRNNFCGFGCGNGRGNGRNSKRNNMAKGRRRNCEL